ncbi:MAG TPA: type VI secretion system tube protein Hcp [Burkholderiales bacterium]|nr:type VI secretion system tube protein Hcp [Burkholderiales bacterium]
MATDIFLKLGDIKGESQDDKHKDEIDVLTWSWGVTQPGSMHTGGGGGMGKANFSDLVIVHHVDKAHPVLLKSCATAEHLKEATLTLRKAGKTPQEFFTIKMNDVMVTSVQPAGNGGEGGHTSTITLQFSKVNVEYKPQKPDGSLDAGVLFKYDIKANKEG